MNEKEQQVKTSFVDIYILFLTPPILYFLDKDVFRLFFHYVLYLTSLVLVISILLEDIKQKGATYKNKTLHFWAPRILHFTIVFDFVHPLSDIPSFVVLKSIFYLLVILELSRFLFDRTVLTNFEDKYSFCSILLFLCFLFIRKIIEDQSYSFNNHSTEQIWKSFLSVEGIFFVIFIVMIIIIYLIFMENIHFFRYNNQIVVLLSCSSLLITFLNLYYNNFFFNDFGLKNIDYDPHFYNGTFLLLLFIFFLVAALSHSIKHNYILLIAKFSLAFSFFLNYITVNYSNILRAIFEIRRFGHIIGNVGRIAITVIGVIAAFCSIYGLYIATKTRDDKVSE